MQLSEMVDCLKPNPVIAGGPVQTKQETTEALSCGATTVSTLLFKRR